MSDLFYSDRQIFAVNFVKAVSNNVKMREYSQRRMLVFILLEIWHSQMWIEIFFINVFEYKYWKDIFTNLIIEKWCQWSHIRLFSIDILFLTFKNNYFSLIFKNVNIEKRYRYSHKRECLFTSLHGFWHTWLQICFVDVYEMWIMKNVHLNCYLILDMNK